MASRQQRLHRAADAYTDRFAVDDEHLELGMIEACLQRRDDLRERRAAQIGERLGLMHEHRWWTLDDVLFDHERQDLEQRVAIHLGKRLLDVARELANVGTRWHEISF